MAEVRQGLRVLFYIPAATDAWFRAIVAPLIEIAARDAKVHVIALPEWQGTGMSREALERLAHGSNLRWHLYDREDHPTLRTGPVDPRALLRLVESIAPDYSICRSADVETPQDFPGVTSFLMEADYPPLPPRGRVRLSGPAIFDHGAMPDLSDAQRDLLRQAVQPIREAIAARPRLDEAARARFLAQAGLPPDRLIVGVPLEHDGADNFYMVHSPSPVNVDFVRDALTALSDRCLLALTVHPAQRRDPSAMASLTALVGERVRILQSDDGRDLTPTLARHCDAMLFRDSKSIMWAALFGKPFFRLSRFASARWLQAYASPNALEADLQSNAARGPCLEDALQWLGFHVANDAFDPKAPTLTLAALIERIERPLNPDHWASALDRARVDLALAAASIRAIGA